MKRWMLLTAGVALAVAACTSSGTPETTVAGGTQTTAVATTVVSTTVAPVTTVPATTTSGPTTTTAAPATTAPPTTAAPTTTVAPATTTTTVATTVYEVEDTNNPAYYPEPVNAGSNLFGSGCSPGAGPLPNGIWFGELTNVGPNSFDFDLMCFAPNPPGSTEEDGIGDITNDNPLLRTVPVNTSAHVYVLDAAMNWMDMLYQTWSVAPTLGNGCPPGCDLQGWVYVNGGEATEIVMVWTP